MTQPSTDSTTELIAGRYEVERIVARGGMGVVYLAQQVMLNRAVALKVLAPPADVDDGSGFEERFRLEAETLASLDHRNIVTLYDYGQMKDGRFFLALEFIDGPRYTDLLRSGTLTVERSVRLLLQVCSALRYAHKRGVIHRDLKPSNLLIRVDDEGEECVKVVDFGLVKCMEQDHDITRAGLILGSPHCMAPEQIQGQPVDQATDIYAMGVLLFRSITGKWPFHADTGTATMVAHIKDPIPRFADKAPGIEVPPSLESIVRKCLAKQPSQRYSDAVELMRDLRASIGLDPDTATSTSLGGVGTRVPSAALLSTGSGTLRTSSTLLPSDTEHAGAARRPSRTWLWGLVALVFLLVGGAGVGLVTYKMRQAVDVVPLDGPDPIVVPATGEDGAETAPTVPEEPAVEVGGSDATEADATPTEEPPEAEAAPPPKTKRVRKKVQKPPVAETEEAASTPGSDVGSEGGEEATAGEGDEASAGEGTEEGAGAPGYLDIPDDY